jgi:hypothetical protein
MLRRDLDRLGKLVLTPTPLRRTRPQRRSTRISPRSPQVNFFFFAADDERKGVLVTELPREDLLRSSRTLRRRTITVEAPHRRAGEVKEAYSNAPCAPEDQMGGDLYTVAKKKAAKKAKKKK